MLKCEVLLSEKGPVQKLLRHLDVSEVLCGHAAFKLRKRRAQSECKCFSLSVEKLHPVALLVQSHDRAICKLSFDRAIDEGCQVAETLHSLALVHLVTAEQLR